MSATRTPPQRCQIGWNADRSGACGEPPVCEVSLTVAGRDTHWVPACGQHSDVLSVIVKSLSPEMGWDTRARPLVAGVADGGDTHA